MPLNLESNTVADEVPDSDSEAFERLSMPPWMSETFYAAEAEESRLRAAREAEEAVKRRRREREQSDFDLMDFKMRMAKRR